MKKWIIILIVFVNMFMMIIGLTGISTGLFDSLWFNNSPKLGAVAQESLADPQKIPLHATMMEDSFKPPVSTLKSDPLLSHSKLGEKNRQQGRKAYEKRGGELRVENDGVLIEFMHYDKKGNPKYLMTSNVKSALTVNIPPVIQAPYHLDGGGEVVGVWDGGSAMFNHLDFNNGGTPRLFVNDGATPHWHSTHVSGTIASSDIDDPLSLGMSPASRIFSYDWTSDLDEMAEVAAKTGDHTDHIYLSNHSYGTPAGWAASPVSGVTFHWYGDFSEVEDKLFGNYNAKATELDDITTAFPYLLPFVAAGNDRIKVPNQGDTCSYYDTVDQVVKTIVYDPAVHPKSNNHKGGYDTISNAGLAKNIVTVGAVYAAVDQGVRSLSKATMTSFSCWGPCDDGRIKPDLVANGVGVFSAYYDPARPEHNHLHGFGTGTSMASPSLVGSANLIQSYYLQHFGKHLLGNSLKALLIHTADDLGHPGPDYINGWGLVNVEEAIKKIDHQVTDQFAPIIRDDKLLNNETRSYLVYSSGLEPFKVTAVWNDVAATSLHLDDLDVSNQMLVNDLDVKVIDSSNGESLPWVLDVTNYTADATRGNNSVDNVEQVFIAAPAEGFYTISVSHKGTLKYGGQDFSILTSGCTVMGKEIQDLPITHDTKHLLLNEYPTVSNGADFGSFVKNSGTYLKTLVVTNDSESTVTVSNVSIINALGVTVLNSPGALSASTSGHIGLMIDTNLLGGVEKFQLLVEVGTQTYSFGLQCHIVTELFPNSTWSSAWSGVENWEIDSIIHSELSSHSFRSKKISHEHDVFLSYSGSVDAGEVAFKVKVSTERDWDFFTFLIDGIEQVLILENGATGLSGEMGWLTFSQAVTAGNHTFTWKYSKDEAVSRGYDVVWVDEVVVPNSTTDQKVTFLASSGGNISGDLVQREYSGGDCSQITATPLPGYTFVSWDDGQGTRATYTDNPLTVLNVTEEAVYTATFSKDIVTPVIGLNLLQDGRTVTWSIEREEGVKEYRIVDALSGAILKTVPVGEENLYAVVLTQDVDIKLVVVDFNNFEQTFTPPFDSNEVVINYDLELGWNLIATVGDSPDMTELLSVCRGNFWGWENGVYVPVTQPRACEGFWVYSTEKKIVTVSAIKSIETMKLVTGWNLVGPKENRLKPPEASFVFGWNLKYEALLSNNFMISGVGYWVFLSSELK